MAVGVCMQAIDTDMDRGPGEWRYHIAIRLQQQSVKRLTADLEGAT